jgi:glycerol-3-phosphate dehydrogenase
MADLGDSGANRNPQGNPPGNPPQDPRDRVDLLVIGGGINGAGIARDAAGRGLSVVLCEKDDVAQGTSSRSSRLVHGGLRYLEHGEFRLVRESLAEREVLLAIAPHLVRPMQFVLPHVEQMRAHWMLHAGLFVYDHLASRTQLDASRAIALDQDPMGAAVRPEIRRGFTYFDCRTDDARMVVGNLKAARSLGAQVLTRTELQYAEPEGDGWNVRLRNARDGSIRVVRTRTLVNAAGPWVGAAATRILGVAAPTPVRLIKGSHVVVEKFWEGSHAYLLQNVDRRAVFATPYEGTLAMIGTTDVPYEGAPEQVAISPDETRYLCDAANRQLRCALTPDSVVHSYAGVRCLVDDAHANPSEITRDYRLELARAANGASVLSVLGGKITTYRRLAEHVLQLLRPIHPQMRESWTATLPLPGGDLPGGDFDRALSEYVRASALMPPQHASGLFHRHGSLARRILDPVSGPAAAGRHFGAGFYECEARYAIEEEWAQTPEDVLWRRTKFGVLLSRDQREEFTRWMLAQPT